MKKSTVAKIITDIFHIIGLTAVLLAGFFAHYPEAILPCIVLIDGGAPLTLLTIEPKEDECE